MARISNTKDRFQWGFSWSLIFRWWGAFSGRQGVRWYQEQPPQ